MDQLGTLLVRQTLIERSAEQDLSERRTQIGALCGVAYSAAGLRVGSATYENDQENKGQYTWSTREH
jgi:hypothetical protein